MGDYVQMKLLKSDCPCVVEGKWIIVAEDNTLEHCMDNEESDEFYITKCKRGHIRIHGNFLLN